jgi:hypothetical protein
MKAVSAALPGPEEIRIPRTKVACPKAEPDGRERSGQNDGFEQERICVRKS